MVSNNGYVALTGDAFKEATGFFFRHARREDLQHAFVTMCAKISTFYHVFLMFTSIFCLGVTLLHTRLINPTEFTPC